MVADVNDLKRQLETLGVSRTWIDEFLTDPKTGEAVDNATQKERLGIIVNRIQAYSGSIEAQRKAVDLYASQSTLDELRKAAANDTIPNEALRKYFETLKAEADQILASVNAKAATQKVGRILKEATGIDIEKNPEALEELTKDGRLYKILSERTDLSAKEITDFGAAVQSTAGASKSVQDVIAAAAQAKRAVVEANAIARKFAPTLAKVGIGDGPGLLSFSAAIKDGSLMERIEKLTTMVGQDGLTLKDIQEITQTAKGLLEAHKMQATMAADIARANAEAKSAVIGANVLESVFGNGTGGFGDIGGTAADYLGGRASGARHANMNALAAASVPTNFASPNGAPRGTNPPGAKPLDVASLTGAPTPTPGTG
jgi:hypothetical protein